MTYTYYLAYDDGNLIIRWNNSTDKDSVLLERFDIKIRAWVTDWDMCGIYSGDIPARVITEEEALRRIAEQG